MKQLTTLAAGLALLVLPACAADDASEVTSDPVSDAVAADPGHYRVEAENDAVRVVRITYGPSERSSMHSHPATCVVFLTDARFSMTLQSGEPETGENARASVSCGDGEVHLPENLATARAEAVMIELKDRETFDSGATGPAVTGYTEVPDAVTADPAHYTVEQENDVFRVLRIRYGAKDKSIMHAHPAGCAVFLTAQNATFTLPDGTVEKADDQPGDVTCGDASVHLPANAGEQPFELILVELKNRETFN
jgi:quercetin dioxygenase-like cupin family protein